MQLNNLEKLKARSNKRLGRGLGSGKGKTGGRGQKGQKVRGKMPAGFTSGALPLYKKLPFLRGWGNKKVPNKPVAIKLAVLEKLSVKGGIIDLEVLIKEGLVSTKQAKLNGVKILDGGEITKALNLKVPVSKTVAEKIQKAGGTVA